MMNYKRSAYHVLIVADVFISICFLQPICAQATGDSGLAKRDTSANGNKNAMHTPKEMVNSFLEQEKKLPKDSLVLSGSPLLDSIKLESWKSYYSYMSFGYHHRKNVFYWQLISSQIIFFVVIGLVLTGVYFAWLQFYQTLKSIRKTGKDEKALSTELTASFKEIKITSPVLGVSIRIRRVQSHLL